ncbi:hypothetical protein [Streptomyces sp. NPDC001070]
MAEADAGLLERGVAHADVDQGLCAALAMVVNLPAATRCPAPSDVTCRGRRADQTISPRCRLATAGETALKGR